MGDHHERISDDDHEHNSEDHHEHNSDDDCEQDSDHHHEHINDDHHERDDCDDHERNVDEYHEPNSDDHHDHNNENWCSCCVAQLVVIASGHCCCRCFSELLLLLGRLGMLLGNQVQECVRRVLWASISTCSAKREPIASKQGCRL